MATDEHDDWLVMKQVARLLGVSVVTLRDWHRRGVAPPHYVNDRGTTRKRRRYKRSEVEEWLKSCRV